MRPQRSYAGWWSVFASTSDLLVSKHTIAMLTLIGYLIRPLLTGKSFAWNLFRLLFQVFESKAIAWSVLRFFKR